MKPEKGKLIPSRNPFNSLMISGMFRKRVEKKRKGRASYCRKANDKGRNLVNGVSALYRIKQHATWDWVQSGFGEKELELV